MPQTMPWGAEYTLLGEFNLPSNLFTLNDAALGVLDGNCYLDGRTEDDLTDRLLSVEISRGRHDQFQDFQAGTMRLSLSNNDRELDPVNSSSRYWDPVTGTSGVTIRRKITLKYGDTKIFTGRITDIDISYDPTSSPNTRSTVTIDVADDFVLLANTYMDEYLPTPELSGARVNSILALPEVNYTGPTSIETGTITCLDDPVAAQTRTVDALQAVAATERGYLFFKGDGTLYFTDRLSGSSVPSKVFADNGSGQEYESLSIVYGQETLYNRVVCTPIDSVNPGVADDATSQTTFGISTLSLSGLLCSDADAQTLADYLLAQFKDPSYRFDSMGVTFIGNNISLVDQQQIIDLDLGSIVEVIKSFSTGSPSIIQQIVTIEHIDHLITPQAHTITYRFAPAPFSTFSRSVTGVGTGTQTAIGVRITGKTASGSGGAATGSVAVGIHIAPRTATGTGTGTQTGSARNATENRSATGLGTGSQTGTGVAVKLRTASSSGSGTQTASYTIVYVLVLDSGTRGILDTNVLG